MFDRAGEALSRSLTRWDARIARARTLASEHPAAAELLTFYAEIAEYQKLLSSRGLRTLPAVPGAKSAPSFREALNQEQVVAAIPEFLSWLSRRAPASLAGARDELRERTTAAWRNVVTAYLASEHANDIDQPTMFVVEAMVQPFAELLALEGGVRETPSATAARCTICGGQPVLGILRPEGHGARRSLLCGVCLTERDYLRVLCPACGEKQFDVLPIYTAEQFAHIRIDACDRCHTYVKTIDLTKDGLAVPLVDDIASASLDVWARERGYERLRRNLLGL